MCRLGGASCVRLKGAVRKLTLPYGSARRARFFGLPLWIRGCHVARNHGNQCADRASTIQVVIERKAPADLRRPGIFPFEAVEDGVRAVRHTGPRGSFPIAG
jgi:3,4-dihydroxy-2-butanone 4-phosphate synthase